MLIQLIMASLASVVFVAAIYFKKRWEFWAAEAAIILIWVGIITLHLFGIHFVQDMSFTLDLGLFSVLWILAFFHLGLAVKAYKDRNLSFAYLSISFFFFVTATLEIFVISEYFGFGNGMRNNSMFKYGIEILGR